jgi:hypothetical protein
MGGDKLLKLALKNDWNLALKNVKNGVVINWSKSCLKMIKNRLL